MTAAAVERGQVLQLHLPEGAVGVVHHGVAGQLLALLQHRGVEQLLDFAEGAVQPVPAQQFTAPLLDAAGEVVEAFPVPAAAAQELLQGVPGRVAGHDVLGDRRPAPPPGPPAGRADPVLPCTGRTGTGCERS